MGKQHQGHVFASMAASPTSVRGVASQRDYYWRVNFLQQPQDKMFIATPCRFPKGSPVAAALLDWMKINVIHASKTSYTQFMSELRNQVRKWGLEGSILPPICFSAVPYHVKDAALRFSSHVSWDEEVIFREAFGINAFWQSARGADNAKEKHSQTKVSKASNSSNPHTRGSYDAMVQGSLWWKLLQQSRQLRSSIGTPNLQSEVATVKDLGSGYSIKNVFASIISPSSNADLGGLCHHISFYSWTYHIS